MFANKYECILYFVPINSIFRIKLHIRKNPIVMTHIKGLEKRTWRMSWSKQFNCNKSQLLNEISPIRLAIPQQSNDAVQCCFKWKNNACGANDGPFVNLLKSVPNEQNAASDLIRYQSIFLQNAQRLILSTSFPIAQSINIIHYSNAYQWSVYSFSKSHLLNELIDRWTLLSNFIDWNENKEKKNAKILQYIREKVTQKDIWEPSNTNIQTIVYCIQNEISQMGIARGD